MSQPKYTNVFPADPLLYDSSFMPPEERVLSVLEMVFQRPDPALDRLKRYGLPATALYDWIMECAIISHNYLSDYNNRDSNKPRDQWNILAVVPARGGSKGVPRKALRVVGGKTLLQRAIDACRQIKHVKRILVNTDCPEIAAHAREYGAETPFLRPKELADDDSNLQETISFTRYWLLLIEKSYYDFLVVVSAITPGIDPLEINLAMDRLAATNNKSLQPVAKLPSCSLDFQKLNPDGTMQPFFNHPLPDPSRLAVRCGAFSIHGHRPYYQVHPWFHQHVYEVPYKPLLPVAHLLPAAQTIEVDEKWDLDACAMLLQKDCPVQMAATFNKSMEVQSRPSVAEVGPEKLISLVFLPPPERTVEVEGMAAPDRVLTALNRAGIRNIMLWGEAAAKIEEAKRYDLPFITIDSGHITPDTPYDGGMARSDVATLLRRKLSLDTDIPLLLVDSRAGMLKDESIGRLLKLAAVFPGEAVCSVSSPMVHPYYLHQIMKDGTTTPAFEGDASSRQRLPEVVCRDGALYLTQTSKDLPATRGMLIPKAEGRILRDVIDGVRALAMDRCNRGMADRHGVEVEKVSLEMSNNL